MIHFDQIGANMKDIIPESDVVDRAIDYLCETNSSIESVVIIACGNQSNGEVVAQKDVIDARVTPFLSLLLYVFEQTGKPVMTYSITEYSNACRNTDNSISTHVSLMEVKQSDKKIPVRTVASFSSGFAHSNEIKDGILKQIIKNHLSIKHSKSGQRSYVVLVLSNGKNIELEFKVDFKNPEANYDSISIVDDHGNLLRPKQKIEGGRSALVKEELIGKLFSEQASKMAEILSADKNIKTLRHCLTKFFGQATNGSATPVPSPAQARNMLSRV